MASLNRKDASLGLPAWLWAAIALALGVGLTLVVSRSQQLHAQAEREAAFHALATDASVSVADTLQNCERLLRSVQTVFLASGHVAPGEFAHLYQNLHPRVQFPSLPALAYAERNGGTIVLTDGEPNDMGGYGLKATLRLPLLQAEAPKPESA